MKNEMTHFWVISNTIVQRQSRPATKHVCVLQKNVTFQ